MSYEFDVLVIGGGPGGMMAAMTAARHHPGVRVMLVKREEDTIVPCGIPYIFGTLHAVEKDMAALSPIRNLGVEVLIGEVVEVDGLTRTATLDNGEVIAWRKLVLATGATPFIPPIPNVELPGIVAIHKHFDALTELFEEHLSGTKQLVIVGGGFIGVEFSDECRKAGHQVTIVERNAHCLERNFDMPLCERVEAKLREKGIRLVTGVEVAHCLGEGHVTAVELTDGTVLPAEVVLLAVGERRVTELAEQLGLSIKSYGGIWVDSFQCTSHPDIFAVGDCSHKQDFYTRRHTGSLLASIAAAEGRIAGRNLFVRRSLRFNPGTISIYASCIEDLAFGAAGLTESAARQASMEVVVGEATLPDHHPPTMPQTQLMTCRLVFSAQGGALLGGQVLGGATTGEVLNAIGIAIQTKVTAEDLMSFQFGSHPRLTAPIHPIVAATESALEAWFKQGGFRVTQTIAFKVHKSNTVNQALVRALSA